MVEKDLLKVITGAAKKTEKTKPYDTEATVSRVDGDTIWVKIPGGVDETPVKRTIDSKPGDVVMVRVSGGKAWTMGNSTNPPTDDSRANYALIVAQPGARLAQGLDSKNITVDTIYAATGYIDDLYSKNITTENLKATTAYIKDLTAEQIEAGAITTDQLDANYAHISEGVIDNAKIGYADVEDLDAHYARITNGIIDNATINQASVIDLAADYAQIDLANIDQAIVNQEWVDTIMVQSGLISHEGTIFELDAIQVNASKIKAGTIDVERLIVSVPDQQDPTIIHKYMVHVDPTTGTPSYEKMDGDIIEDLTITADKIVAGAITTQKLAVEDIIGPGGWINLRNGTFAYADAQENNYLKWNGSKLHIKADEFILSTGQNILDAIESIETYFLAGEPTLTNEPAVDWTTDNLKNQHLRDIYYDTDSGKSYRWSLSTEEALQDGDGETLQDEDDNDLIGQHTEIRYAWIQIADGDIASLSDRLSVAETNIAQNQTEIQLKASQTDLDLATSRLTQAETTISQQAQAISLKAEASSVYSKMEIDGKFHEGLNVRTSFSDTAITLSATVILAGVNVNDNYLPGDFEWFYRSPDGDEFVKGDRTSSYGKSITIQKSDMKYGNSIICVFTKRAEEPILDGDGNPLTDENDDALIGYVEVA